MKTCVFAGTFDPITLGHENFINKCLSLYEKVVVVIGENPEKSTLFSTFEREEIVKKVYEKNDRITVVKYADYGENYTNFLLSLGQTDYVRGIRNEKDREYEESQIEKNKKLYPFINTVFISADSKYEKISSSVVREKLSKNQSVKSLMSKVAHQKMLEILSKK